MPLVAELSFLIVLLPNGVNFADIGQGVEGHFVGPGQAVVQDGFGLVNILVEEIGSVDERTVGDGECYIFDFEGDHIMVAFGGFSDVVFMVFRADVAEDLRAVVDIGLDQFFKEMGRGNIHFRSAALLLLLLL